MSSTKRFFLFYVSLIAIANSVHANAGSNNSGEAAGVIGAIGDIIGKFAPNQNSNMMEGGGLMNLGGNLGQNGMMQNGMPPAGFQGVPGMNGLPGMNQSGMFPGQMGPNASMPWNSGEQQQIPGTPMLNENGQPIIDPTTGQPVLTPQPGSMLPGSPMRGANGQPIINPMTGQPVLVPQPATNQNSMMPGQMNINGTMPGMPGEQPIPGTPMRGANGQPIIDPTTGQPVLTPQPGSVVPGAPMRSANGQPIIDPTTGQPVLAPQPGALGMGGVLAGPIDESVLMDPRLNPGLYAEIMTEAQKDPQLMQALERVKLELNADDAKMVRASLLKPILVSMNLNQAQKAQEQQMQQMQQMQSMQQAAQAARLAEKNRMQTIEAEISRLEQENNQIISDLKRQGVSQEEINSIVSRSRQDAVLVAGNSEPFSGMPQMPGTMGGRGVKRDRFGNTLAQMPDTGGAPLLGPQGGGPQAGGFNATPPQQQGGLPVFGGQARNQQGATLPQMPQLGKFGNQAQQQPGGLPVFGGQARNQQGATLPQMPQLGKFGNQAQQQPGGLPVFGGQARNQQGATLPQMPQLGKLGNQAQQQPGGLPIFGGGQAINKQQTIMPQQEESDDGQTRMPQMAF